MQLQLGSTGFCVPLQQHGVHVPIVNGDPVAIDSFELQRAFCT